MGHIFDAYGIPSCVLCRFFFNSLCWMFISRVSRICPILSHFSLCLRLVLRLFHQGFLFVGVAFVSFIGYPDRNITLIQRRTSYLPFTPSCGALGFDMTVVGGCNPPKLVSFLCFCVLNARMGGVSPSVLDPLVVA